MLVGNPLAAQGDQRRLAGTDFYMWHGEASVFTPDAEVTGARLLSTWYPRFVNMFDGEPVAFPGMEGAPREIPRAIFASRDGVWRCEVSPERLTIHWNRQAPIGALMEADLPPIGQAAEALLDYQHTM